ncbi:hypothetical protein OS493_032915 [Desmophyllum pertusum]|uniref:Uncharacterized protein n=1 Tax=Desmophyllum pertusum TaxID=174260 RepID=A0A9W9YJD3_9CNID|nr:hypothetical protein OS493_032915 [Desmophyllum pertusum]
MRCLLKSDLPTDAINVTVPEVEKYKRKHSRNRAKSSPSTQLATHQGEEANVTAETTSREAIIDGPSCSHDSATLLSQKPVNTEGMNRPALALNSLQSALNMCSKIKTEDFSGAVTAPSGVDAPETLSCISYYLRATYQLLFGADVQDVQESVGVTRQQQQFQEAAMERPPQGSRARRRRVRRVWNGEEFVPEGQQREQTVPYVRRRRGRRRK